MRKVLCLACFVAFFSLGTLAWADEPADPFAPSVEPTKELSWTQRLYSAALKCIKPSTVSRSAAEAAPVELTVLGEPEETPIDEQATHEQTNLIELEGKSDSFQVQAFTLDKQGRLLVACSTAQGEVRVLDGDGKLLATWKLEIKPEAINVAPDSSVLVAGAGKIIRLSSEGKVLQEVDAPHVTHLKENKQKLRESAIAALKQRSGDVSGQLESMEKMLSQIEEKSQTETLDEEDERILKLLPDYIKQLKAIQLARAGRPGAEPSEEAIEEQVQRLLKSKQGISSISADEQHVYLATPALSGYTYEVWRMDPDFADPKVIVSDLRGCCGHMDVQASTAGIYVAENARHRVVSYQPNGKEITEWGGRDRTGIDGFTSCCNPMNVCFNRTGDVFTAESSTGRIKRFSPQGKFKEFVGDVKLVPGCKNVSIAVSTDDASVYMLDITRNHIVHMKRKVSTEKVE